MMDEAAAREIDGLIATLERREQTIHELRTQLAESERQRKQLSEYIETLARGGIEAAVGAGK